MPVHPLRQVQSYRGVKGPFCAFVSERVRVCVRAYIIHVLAPPFRGSWLTRGSRERKMLTCLRFLDKRGSRRSRKSSVTWGQSQREKDRRSLRNHLFRNFGPRSWFAVFILFLFLFLVSVDRTVKMSATTLTGIGGESSTWGRYLVGDHLQPQGGNSLDAAAPLSETHVKRRTVESTETSEAAAAAAADASAQKRSRSEGD